MKINEVAKLTGITVRTLHYYDEIGLLPPTDINEAGYRIYDETVLATLQQILFFKELDFPLNEIKQIITNPTFNKVEALKKHKELLLKKRDRVDKLINLVDNTIKGEDTMSFKEFDMTELEATKKKYAAEVKERWGDTAAYAESEKKTNHYDKDQWKEIGGEGSELFKAFAMHMNQAPDSHEVQTLVKQWQDYITDKFYHCTNEILEGLGLMYTGDERFKANIDRYADGLAEFISQAIAIYCSK